MQFSTICVQTIQSNKRMSQDVNTAVQQVFLHLSLYITHSLNERQAAESYKHWQVDL